ncbi:MAG TPA: cold shock domain-containing protein, partial [Saprospiraceae bacterium]|nr:cold shock domain-containing protein [Saprospiraceae bacterium]
SLIFSRHCWSWRSQPIRKQMTDRLQGEVVFFNSNSFGFIKPDTGDQDAFFHISELLPDQAAPVWWNVYERAVVIVSA